VSVHLGRVGKLVALIALGLVAGVTLVPAARALRPAPASAVALPFRLGLHVTGDAREGAVNLVRVAVSAPATTSCTLQITAEHFEKRFRSDRLGSVVWNWRAPVRAPKGVWTFAATCSEGARWARYWFQAEMGFPERSGALVAAPPVGTPAASSDSCDSQGVCFASDPFPVGQCTWYAAGRRPDLIGIVHGDAWEWLGAASGRVPEGSRPAVGAIAVFAPGAPGGTGHVAYVAAISGSRVLLDDSNWRPTPWSPWLEVHEHWEPASSASGYIYGGPVSSAP
jgi:surface antigen